MNVAIDAHRVVCDGRTCSIIDRADKTVALVSASWSGKSAAFAVGNSGLIGYWKNKEAVLERDDGAVVVQLRNPSAWAVSLSFEYGGRTYDLCGEPMRTTTRSTFCVYRDDGVCVAEFDPTPAYPKTMQVRFAQQLPLEINVFLFWLAWASWQTPFVLG